ncbi:chemotaxis protein CheA [Acidihalobacter ferrooxydans]|uniref:Chemotaxis protein CheA n=2 Tax=Acidihalobacter ferrooxydans TaxID=1765967 RepID=A0A1P8UGQ3_9GAMM|nr:chemotaxis protein CheA [Acidihalobacter ferrooxydans]
MDQELVQEFVVEAQELLEQAQNDALALEGDPHNDALLASLFRAFHTLKGGAGFVEARSLVDWTHHLEDLLDKLRAQSLSVTPERIDVILRGSDVISDMLGALASGQMPEPGPETLGRRIQEAAREDSPPSVPEETADNPGTGRYRATRREKPDGDDGIFVERTDADSVIGDYIDEMFADGGASQADEASPQAGEHAGEDEITDAEFERYLDVLYEGTAPGMERPDPSNAGTAPHPPPPPPPAAKAESTHAPPPQSAGSGSTRVAGETTLRVEAARLDEVMNQVGELVLLRNRYNASVSALGVEDEQLTRIARELDLTVNDLQTSVMRLRMQPCSKLFQAMPRVVRDASRRLGKQVRLVITGEDVEIDKTVIDALSGPLTHLVRNSLDHGIETPEEREACGKPTEATLKLAAIHLGDRVRIEVSDDGRGLDAQAVARKAVEKGLLDAHEAARLSRQEMLDLIFRPGFSTKDQASELSGRGVGMDVVKETVRSLRGRLELHTEPGKGSTVAMEFPLSLAVLPVLYAKLRRDTYALPISAIDSLLDIEPQRMNRIRSRVLYRVSDQDVLPVIDLGEILQQRPLRLGAEPVEGILTQGGVLLFSEVLGNEDCVVKPLDFVGDQHWYQGASLSGQGRVILILDPQAMVRLANEQTTAG